MDFYTSVLRRSGQYWVALCLENGLVGQGLSKEEALGKLKEAIDSLMEVQGLEDKLSHTTIAINELHEFLTIEETDVKKEPFEMWTVNA
ncbi:MAG: hypothetical protein U5L00_03615 [Desulfovermiculus sp.]|nr:hypothetical protein [Desulfovermiculus sp.]